MSCQLMEEDLLRACSYPNWHETELKIFCACMRIYISITSCLHTYYIIQTTKSKIGYLTECANEPFVSWILPSWTEMYWVASLWPNWLTLKLACSPTSIKTYWNLKSAQNWSGGNATFSGLPLSGSWLSMVLSYHNSTNYNWKTANHWTDWYSINYTSVFLFTQHNINHKHKLSEYVHSLSIATV